jgi:hypothetical protein
LGLADERPLIDKATLGHPIRVAKGDQAKRSDESSLVCIAITGTIRSTASAVDIVLVGAENMLRQITPAVLASRLVRMIRIAQVPGHINCLAPQVNAGRRIYRLGHVVVLNEGHA